MIRCPKCGMWSGDDWSQCVGGCPMPGSPAFDETIEAQYRPIDMNDIPFAPPDTFMDSLEIGTPRP